MGGIGNCCFGLGFQEAKPPSEEVIRASNRSIHIGRAKLARQLRRAGGAGLIAEKVAVGTAQPRLRDISGRTAKSSIKLRTRERRCCVTDRAPRPIALSDAALVQAPSDCSR